MKIAVVSDLHINMVAPESWSRARALLRQIVRSKVDHVILAGDLFDCLDAFDLQSEEVADEFDALGLWDPDRLTVVVGNHDVHQTPHHGTWADRIATYGKNDVMSVSSVVFEHFNYWSSGSRDKSGWLTSRVHMKELEGVRIFGVDTVRRSAFHSGNGVWEDETDHTICENTRGSPWTIVVGHHAPFESPKGTFRDVLRGKVPLGYPPKSYARLLDTVNEAVVDAFVSGHVHRGRPRQWTIGERTKVFLAGRADDYQLLTVTRKGIQGEVVPLYG